MSDFISLGGDFIIAAIMAVSLLCSIAINVSLKKKLDKVRKELHSLYEKKYIAGPSGIVVSSMDDELLKRAIEMVEQHINDDSYDVGSLVSGLGVSRTMLYQKIHELTGMSVKEFIRDIKFRRAAQLLKESSMTVSEISFMSGFANPKYFSISFKKRFGMTPSEFREERFPDQETVE